MIEEAIATVRLDRPRPDRSSPRPGSSRGWRAALHGLIRRMRRWRVRPEKLEDGHWWNGSLRSADQLETASRRARSIRLPLHQERDRNWDALEALELIVERSDRAAPIADVGLRPYRPLLDWLQLLGFERLQPEPALRARTNRRLAAAGERPDVTGRLVEGPETERYGVVTCRSLPGDGIPLGERLVQGAVLLEPGGTLLLSTEFWNLPDPYQGSERDCARDHVCCRRMADGLIRRALDLGLVPIAPVYLGEAEEQRHPDLLGVGVSPLKLAFRKREPAFAG